MLRHVGEALLQDPEQGQGALGTDRQLPPRAREPHVQPLPRSRHLARVLQGGDKVEVLLHHPEGSAQLVHRFFGSGVQVGDLFSQDGDDRGASLARSGELRAHFAPVDHVQQVVALDDHAAEHAAEAIVDLTGQAIAFLDSRHLANGPVQPLELGPAQTLFPAQRHRQVDGHAVGGGVAAEEDEQLERAWRPGGGHEKHRCDGGDECTGGEPCA